MNLSKGDLEDIRWREDNGNLSPLMKIYTGKIRILKNYVAYLNLKGDFPSEGNELRHKTITLQSWNNFTRDPESTKLLEPSGDMPSNPPLGLSGSLGSSSHQLTPVESFKRSIKIDSSQFINLKEGKHCDTWRMNALATSRDQDVDKVLDPYYTLLTQEDMNLFKENRRLCTLFSLLPCKMIEARSLL